MQHVEIAMRLRQQLQLPDQPILAGRNPIASSLEYGIATRPKKPNPTSTRSLLRMSDTSTVLFFRHVNIVMIVLTFTASGLFWIVSPRATESTARGLFCEDVDLDKSWITRRLPGKLDRALGFDGFVEFAYLRGSDPYFYKQLQALERFSQLESVEFIEASHSCQMRGKLSTVRKVKFSYCDQNFIVDVLPHLSNVQAIEFFECPTLNDIGLERISGLRELEAIDIDGSSVAGLFAKRVEASSGINSLEIRYSPISRDGLSAISQLRSLRRLVIEHPTTPIDWESAEYLLSEMPNVRELVLTGFLEEELKAEMVEETTDR